MAETFQERLQRFKNNSPIELKYRDNLVQIILLVISCVVMVYYSITTRTKK